MTFLNAGVLKKYKITNCTSALSKSKVVHYSVICSNLSDTVSQLADAAVLMQEHQHVNMFWWKTSMLSWCCQTSNWKKRVLKLPQMLGCTGSSSLGWPDVCTHPDDSSTFQVALRTCINWFISIIVNISAYTFVFSHCVLLFSLVFHSVTIVNKCWTFYDWQLNCYRFTVWCAVQALQLSSCA